MWEVLKLIFTGRNRFASGGLVLMILGGLGVYLHALPRSFWNWFVQQTTMMITVKEDDAAFFWVKEWFLDQEFLTRVRRLDLDTTLRGEHIAMIPAPGRHWFWRGGRLYRVLFRRSEEAKNRVARRAESFTFWTVGRRQSILREFVDDVAASHRKRARDRSCLYLCDGGWDRSIAYTPRWLGSVILPEGARACLLRDVKRFKESRDRYRKLGIPYHRGYLFYGPPGTGKTSLVSALAAEFHMSIYAMNLTAFTDRSLINAMNDIPANSVVLFEDIDCMKAGKARANLNESAHNSSRPAWKRERGDRLGVTLSGLLNVLDGFHAPDGVLFLMTSNQIDTLDAALPRPGRIDYRLFLGPATANQKLELYRRFFPGRSELEAAAFVDLHAAAMTMAEFQGLLLKHEAAPEEIASEPKVKTGITESETVEEAVIR
jgi:chaperone BCS1